MFIRFLLLCFSCTSLCAQPLADQFESTGYLEICNRKQDRASFENLYIYFDELIEFLQSNPVWTQKLYAAKERFIRSKDRNYYSTDFFGLFDESKRIGRDQISFYYSIHFHEFIIAYCPEFKRVPEIIRFLDACQEIQKPCLEIFEEAATELGLDIIYNSILFKVVKYFPSYKPLKPHYDGAALSLLLDSTDNESLLLSSYKAELAVEDFHLPIRDCLNSVLLIPGSFLSEFGIYPTPHIVVHSGKTRYAAVAFAMRPNYTPQKNELFPLPSFKN